MMRLKTAQKRIRTLRRRIDATDRALLKALAARMRVVERIGKVKVAAGVPLLQKARWDEVMKKRIELASEAGLDASFVTELYKQIHKEALRIQGKIK